MLLPRIFSEFFWIIFTNAFLRVLDMADNNNHNDHKPTYEIIEYKVQVHSFKMFIKTSQFLSR